MLANPTRIFSEQGYDYKLRAKMDDTTAPVAAVSVKKDVDEVVEGSKASSSTEADGEVATTDSEAEGEVVVAVAATLEQDKVATTIVTTEDELLVLDE